MALWPGAFPPYKAQSGRKVVGAPIDEGDGDWSAGLINGASAAWRSAEAVG